MGDSTSPPTMTYLRKLLYSNFTVDSVNPGQQR
jgi:hypothetical protein